MRMEAWVEGQSVVTVVQVVTAVMVVTAATAVTAVIAVVVTAVTAVTAVKLAAAVTTARAPREQLTRLGESEATTTRGLHVRATSSCNCLRTNANPSALQSLQHLKTSYNTLTLLHVTRSHICDRDRRIPFPTQPKSYILGPTKPRCAPTPTLPLSILCGTDKIVLSLSAHATARDRPRGGCQPCASRMFRAT